MLVSFPFDPNSEWVIIPILVGIVVGAVGGYGKRRPEGQSSRKAEALNAGLPQHLNVFKENNQSAGAARVASLLF